METNFLTLKMRDTPFLGGNFEAESSREFTRGFYGWGKRVCQCLFERFPGCFAGIGKQKGFQLKIPIDPEVQPLAQPIRRGLYHLCDKLSSKPDELVALDTIEKGS